MSGTFTDRLISLKSPTESRNQFLLRLGIHSQHWARWKAQEGRTGCPGINMGTVMKLADETGVTPAWLAFGVGPLVPPKTDHTPQN